MVEVSENAKDIWGNVDLFAICVDSCLLCQVHMVKVHILKLHLTRPETLGRNEISKLVKTLILKTS